MVSISDSVSVTSTATTVRQTIHHLLHSAEQLAWNTGDNELAIRIADLIKWATPEPPPFDPPYSVPFDQQYMLPSGKYHGRFLSELGTTELQSIWAGFNGCGYKVVADKIKAEIDRRIATQ